MPYLISIGNTATDDREGKMMLEKLEEEAGNDPDISLVININNNDRVVGTLMRLKEGDLVEFCVGKYDQIFLKNSDNLT